MPDSTAQHAVAKQPTVLVGVTGCIAAYKACEVVRGLQKAGVPTAGAGLLLHDAEAV